MKQDVAELWVKALRSGDYEQGYHKLKTPEGEFCCLGVLCEILHVPSAKRNYYGSEGSTWFYGEDSEPTMEGTLPSSARKKSGIYNSDGAPIDINARIEFDDDESFDSLVAANDAGYTFDAIADWIEEHYEEI